MEVPRVELVVLGLLAEGPMHGYELLERYRARGMDRWVGVGRASVYQALRRLEDRGLLHGQAGRRQLGPEPRVVRLTRPGRDRLRRGIEERFDPAAAHAEALLAVGFLHLVPEQVVLGALEARADAVELALRGTEAAMGHLGDAAGPANAAARSMLELERARLEAERAWLGRLRAHLGLPGP